MNPGDKLGAYEILEPLGAGGMGEVYRARDPRLDRDVAIKVLPEDFAADGDRLARFEREAKLLAQLNHANIAGIYGLEDADGVRFIAMECVEGETLAERLAAKGRIEVDEALEIARQIAQALETAHEAGIVHRDLKPANVKITPDDKVKVLDFGLAKAYEADGSASEISPDLSHSPTMAAATTAGVIMGTAAYMSPEQARGKRVDKRTDIWAFGAVFYEMLTGSKAFTGATATDVLAAVVKDQPAWGSLPADTPPLVASLLRRCVRKDPARRLHDIADARIEIEEAQDEPWSGQGTVAASTTSAAWLKVVLAAAVVWAIAATTGLFTRPAGDDSGGIEFHFTIDAPDSFNPTPDIDLSRDGTRLVFTGMGPEGRQLWLRHLDSATSEPIPGTAGAVLPFWAPSGESVAYFQQGRLIRLDLPDRTMTLADAPNGRGGSWGTNDVIVFSPNGTVIYQVPADRSSEATPVTELDTENGELDHRFPNFLPDGRRFTFFNRGVGQIWVGSIDSSERTMLREARSEGVVIPGHLLFLNQGILMVQPFDGETLELTGEPTALATDMSQGLPTGNAEVGASYTGVLAYRMRPGMETRLTWFDRSGGKLGEIGRPGRHGSIELSPNGRQVAFGRSEPGGVFVYLLDLDSGRYEQLAPGDFPTWLHDSSGVVLRRAGALHRRIRGAAGGEEETLIDDVRTPMDSDVSADGRLLAFVFFDPATSFNIWTMDLNDFTREELVGGLGRQEHVGFSPDGKWLAYMSDHSGTQQIYVISLAERTRLGPLSVGGGVRPRWRGDSQELFYMDPRGVLMSVQREGEEFRAPEPLFERGPLFYTVSDDGQRFLLPVPEAKWPQSDVHVLTNWARSPNRR